MSYKRIPMFDRAWGYTGSAALVSTLLDRDIPVLTAFDFQFLNGDHHIKSFLVGGKTYGEDGETPDSYIFGWGDEDYGISGRADDRAAYKIIYYAIRPPHLFSSSERSISGTSTNRLNNIVSIPRLAEDEIFVLRGFEFWGALGRSNHHLRSIEVRYDMSMSAIRVNFIDNSPQDDQYGFTIRYFVLKRNCISGRLCLKGIFTDSFVFTNTVRRTKSHQGNALLSGFKFRFLDNDHHIRRIAIDVEPRAELMVAFTDSENNHRVEADIDYVTLDWSNFFL